MRIGLLCVPTGRSNSSHGGSSAFDECARALVRGMESLGHRVDLIPASGGEVWKFPAYEYVAVLAEQRGLFGGVMPEELAPALGAGVLVGKKGAAFLRKTGPFTGRGLLNLMHAMEKEGMVVNFSEVVLSAAHGEALGKRTGA